MPVYIKKGDSELGEYITYMRTLYPNFEMDIKLFNTLEDSLTDDIMCSLVKPRIVFGIHMWNENNLYPNELLSFNVIETGIKDFNYNGIIKKLEKITHKTLPDRDIIITEFKNNYRNSKIETILK